MTRKLFFLIATFCVLILALTINNYAAPVVRSAVGANGASIQSTVDQFRADLGTLNPNNGQSFTSGRREINWDGVPDNLSAPNFMPLDFFNVNSPRGVVFSSTSENSALLADGQQAFQVSADDSTTGNTAVRFGNIDPTYTATFQTFSAQRLFTMHNSHVLEISFFIPGTNIPATVSGFGAVFSDVDSANTHILLFDAKGRRLPGPSFVAALGDETTGLSFQGISYNGGERIARAVVIAGNADLKFTNVDTNNGVTDVVAMDDFIYGEPRATEHHASDFDGDGTTDLAVFRPTTGDWFVLNSGSSTFRANHFGASGDVPIDGDFDGDSRSDLAVFRPSIGTWFISRSSDNAFVASQFGTSGDKPVAGDYDKDGKTDIAVWRPSNGTYFNLNSSNGQFKATQFGQNGDIPIGSPLNP
jgi:hypothetical protein